MKVCSTVESLTTKSFFTVVSLAVEKKSPLVLISVSMDIRIGTSLKDIFPLPFIVGVAVRMEIADLQQQGSKVDSSCSEIH